MVMNNTSNRGFASMDNDKQRVIASKGGQSVPAEKRSFSRDPALAAQAGRKGGENVPNESRSFSKNPQLASEAGRKGGHASGGNFANDRERASRVGRRGGEASHGENR
jgi:general stress protein YciG